MAVSLAQWQATYDLLKAKYDEAAASAAPTFTVPGGATLNRMDYLRQLREEMKAIAEMVPGVAPEAKPVWEVWG